MNALEKAIEVYYLTNGYENNRNNLVELLDIDITKNMTCSNGSCISSDGTSYSIFGEILTSVSGYYIYASRYDPDPSTAFIMLQAIKNSTDNKWVHYCVTGGTKASMYSNICQMYLNN